MPIIKVSTISFKTGFISCETVPFVPSESINNCVYGIVGPHPGLIRYPAIDTLMNLYPIELKIHSI